MGEFDYRYEWPVFVPCPAKDMSGLVQTWLFWVSTSNFRAVHIVRDRYVS